MKLWGGRFEKETEEFVHAFSSSLSFDHRLVPYDIAVSQAHALALQECGVLSRDEAESITTALREIGDEIEGGDLDLGGDEDIHTTVERKLVERLGDTGAKLRAARSRNDQVAADLRLFLKDACKVMERHLLVLMRTILEQASMHLDTLMPGFTHLQPAQPVLLAHHLLAYFEMFRRDLERMEEARRLQDRCPLGSGALAGVTFSLERESIAERLGFSAVTANSMDAVSDRDFAADFLYACCMAAVHLSRLAEEIVLWSTPYFAFVELDEAYTTGSSIMPQKANPDVAELVRGKTGRIFGHLVALFTMLKGLPLTYNRDLQEDKEGIFDTCDQLASMLEVMARSLAAARFNVVRMKEAAEEGHANATDLADYLVRKGLPFLQAHDSAGRLVRHCLDRGIGLEELPLQDYRDVQPMVDEDVFECLVLEACVAARDLPGGTAPGRVERALGEAKDWLEAAFAARSRG
ncbi:MAG: argininosuccinate lyase [Actinobacteria bacterium]|jgi:argininosuccinate lyase|nr:MAG: argininosuccinate lyase [Actinomycetota bacterium]